MLAIAFAFSFTPKAFAFTLLSEVTSTFEESAKSSDGLARVTPETLIGKPFKVKQILFSLFICHAIGISEIHGIVTVV